MTDISCEKNYIRTRKNVEPVVYTLKREGDRRFGNFEDFTHSGYTCIVYMSSVDESVKTITLEISASPLKGFHILTVDMPLSGNCHPKDKSINHIHIVLIPGRRYYYRVTQNKE